MNIWIAGVAFAGGFIIAQLAKAIIGLVTERKTGVVNFQTAVGYLTRSGGMPSGHAASFTALTVYLGCTEGFNTAVFALSLATLLIILYDAIHVRYAVGEQGKALNKLLKQAGEPELPLVEGHTVPQVVVGILIGVLLGWGLYTITTTPTELQGSERMDGWVALVDNRE